MFDNISFDVDVQDAAGSLKDRKYSREVLIPFYSHIESDTIAGDTWFLLKSQKLLFQIPLTRTEKENFLYLQFFSYMLCGRHFSSRRENYHSYQLIYTYSGKAAVEYKGKKEALAAGDLCVVDCRQPHYFCCDGDSWEFSSLHFAGGKADYLFQNYFDSDDFIIHMPADNNYQILLDEILRLQSSKHQLRVWKVSHAIEALLLMIISVRNDPVREMPARIGDLIAYMENRFRDPITLDELAERSSVSKYHLIREFKKYTGKTPKEYLITLRLQHARELLLTTDLPVYVIGMLTGFTNETNFSRLFQKLYQMTPGEYRKNR